MDALQRLERQIMELEETAEALRSRIQYLLYLNEDTGLIAGERVAAASSALKSVTELLRSLLADSTLRRWADAYQWRERREELARAEADIRIDTIRSRAAILRHLIEAQDGKAASQIAFAVASLGNLELQYQKALLAGDIANPAKPEKPVKVSSRAEAIAVLKQAVNNKLGTILSDEKYVTTDSVTDIAKCLALVQELEATLPKEEADTMKGGGVSADIAERLDKALGLVK